MSGNPSNTGIIIVPDGIVDENHKIREFIAANYSMDDKKEVEKFEQKVEKIYDETRWNYMVPMVNTKNNIIDQCSWYWSNRCIYRSLHWSYSSDIRCSNSGFERIIRKCR